MFDQVKRARSSGEYFQNKHHRKIGQSCITRSVLKCARAESTELLFNVCKRDDERTYAGPRRHYIIYTHGGGGGGQRAHTRTRLQVAPAPDSNGELGGGRGGNE